MTAVTDTFLRCDVCGEDSAEHTESRGNPGVAARLRKLMADEDRHGWTSAGTRDWCGMCSAYYRCHALVPTGDPNGSRCVNDSASGSLLCRTHDETGEHAPLGEPCYVCGGLCVKTL